LGRSFNSQTNKDKVALWTTYHPTEIKVTQFVKKCELLIALDIKFSVGIVGKIEHFSLAQQLRDSLPTSIYVWVNAYKRVANYYTQEDIAFLNQIDPLFNLNNTIYNTKGKACAAGESSLSIDGAGNISRCHFIKDKLGNIYEQALSEILKPRACSNNQCRCYIGYMHLKELDLSATYGDRVLERIPLEQGH